VLATTVGPYARLGVDVARACAEHGTHYADITGEEGFVRTLEREVDPVAHRERGHDGGLLRLRLRPPRPRCAASPSSHLPDDADVVMRGYVQRERTHERRDGAHGARCALRSGTVVPPPDRHRTRRRRARSTG
jgi:hypothetical protein